eukprot:3368-Heterococcus_DN1.PRE.5
MQPTTLFAELLHAPHLTVITLCDCTGAWDADAYVAQIMSRLRVDHIHAQPVDRLSGGERKRVALAAALIQKPDLLILD